MTPLAAFALLLTTAAAPAASKPFVLGGDPAKGQTTFKTYCVTCHGEKGAGDGVAAAALNPKPANFTDPKRAAGASDEYIYRMIKEGGAANGKSPLMVAWGPTIDDASIRNVAAYVRAFSKPAGKSPAPKANPSKPAAKTPASKTGPAKK